MRASLVGSADDGGLLGQLLRGVPRPIRFLGIDGFRLLTDLGVFSLLLFGGITPLPARALALVLATTVTWRLNRVITFDRGGREPHDGALRHAALTATAQGTSYLVFSLLVLTGLAGLPHAALIVGAVLGELVAYNGHRLLTTMPQPGWTKGR